MLLCGVDEVGRGPLAGPVVAAAVILKEGVTIAGVADSKKISAKKRAQLFPIIQQNCVEWATGRAEVYEIDSMNILQATLLAMQRAIDKLVTKPALVLVDGIHSPCCKFPVKTVIQGDQSIQAISAASILAKVIRDLEMMGYAKKYPEYGFANHKGYGTAQHIEAIKKYGITPIHRRSFAPISLLIGDTK
jgi:ribonuclease HII